MSKKLFLRLIGIELVIVALVMFATGVEVQAAPIKFELEPICIHTEERGVCVIFNRYPNEIKCRFDMNSSTENGAQIRQIHDVVVPPNAVFTKRIFAPKEDKLATLGSTAACQLQ